MKKFSISFMIVLIFSLTSIHPLHFIQAAHAQQKPVPSYAKWGRMAMKVVKKKYPNDQIIDYLHIGRIKGARTSTEKFKLWLKGKETEFGVFVDIEFNNETENIVNIVLKETPR
jgi:hypothetical protein